MISKGIIVIPTQGFANRMRMLISSIIYAKSLNLPLLVCWIASEECNIELNEIFTNDMFDTISFEDIQNTNYCYFGRVHTNQIFNKIDDVINDTEHKYEYVLLEGGHEFTNKQRLDFLSLKKSTYNELSFINTIDTKLNDFIQNKIVKNKKYIGIHYRDVINKYDEMDIKNNDVVNFTKNSPIEKFIEIINKIKNDTTFIVISNSNKIYETLVNKFPNKKFINSPSESYNRNLKDDMINSIVDFLILGQCDLIVGSYFSSFSDEASFINFIPKITPLSDDLQKNINKTVQTYHCLNYSFIDDIAALNYNDKIFLEYLNI